MGTSVAPVIEREVSELGSKVSVVAVSADAVNEALGTEAGVAAVNEAPGAGSEVMDVGSAASGIGDVCVVASQTVAGSVVSVTGTESEASETELETRTHVGNGVVEQHIDPESAIPEVGIGAGSVVVEAHIDAGNVTPEVVENAECVDFVTPVEGRSVAIEIERTEGGMGFESVVLEVETDTAVGNVAPET